MPNTRRSEIDESHAQYQGAWRRFALSCETGEVVERPEVYITAGHVTWPLMNSAFLTAPVSTEGALKTAVASAARYYSAGKNDWTFVLGEDWVSPEVQGRAEPLLAEHGLKPLMVCTGMVADQLQAPRRPLPPLDLRPVSDAWGRQAISDVNAACYDTPQDIGREALDTEALYGSGSLGFVACRDGVPVATTVAMRVGDINYIALVATLPEHRRLGAAETVLRHALDAGRRAWGLERTVLHATPAGFPVYLRMGYRAVTRFTVFMSGDGHH